MNDDKRMMWGVGFQSNGVVKKDDVGGNKLVDVEDFLMDDMCGYKRDDVEGIEFAGKEFDDIDDAGS